MSARMPRPCRDDIFKKGVHVCWIAGRAFDIEAYVRQCAEQTKQEIDWHYVGGRANVLTLGNVMMVQGWMLANPRSWLQYGGLPASPFGCDTQ